MRGAIFSLFDWMTGDGSIVTVALSFFSVFMLIFVCFPFRGCACALVAHWLGDDTASEQGRFTLNPLSHIDPVGALFMCLCGIGWGKPMPINIRRCRKVTLRTAQVLLALTGPLSLILLAFIMLVITKILLETLAITTTIKYIVMALQMVAGMCAFLAIFNLLPVPPFDGYALIQGILPRRFAIWVERNSGIINMVVLVLIAAGVVSGPLSFLSGKLMDFLCFITFQPNFIF